MEYAPDLPEEIDAEVKDSGLAGDLNPQPTQKEAVLSKPSKEFANKLLNKLDFQESFVGYKMHPLSGNAQYYLYSFEDVTKFLHFDAGDPNIKGTGSIGYINLDKLQHWVKEVFADEELSNAIGEKIKECNNYDNRVEAIKPLLEQRIKQCKEIVGEDVENII